MPGRVGWPALAGRLPEEILDPTSVSSAGLLGSRKIGGLSIEKNLRRSIFNGIKFKSNRENSEVFN